MTIHPTRKLEQKGQTVNLAGLHMELNHDPVRMKGARIVPP